MFQGPSQTTKNAYQGTQTTYNMRSTNSCEDTKNSEQSKICNRENTAKSIHVVHRCTMKALIHISATHRAYRHVMACGSRSPWVASLPHPPKAKCYYSDISLRGPHLTAFRKSNFRRGDTLSGEQNLNKGADPGKVPTPPLGPGKS
jgi:hypothetical protein